MRGARDVYSKSADRTRKAICRSSTSCGMTTEPSWREELSECLLCSFQEG